MSKKTLQDSLIRLAYTKPELRKDLMPILKEAVASRALETLRIRPGDKRAEEEVYKQYERGLLSEEDIAQALPKSRAMLVINEAMVRAFKKNMGNEKLWDKLRQRARKGLINPGIVEGLEYEKDHYDIHMREQNANSYFDELDDDLSKIVEKWLRALPRLAKRYVPEIGDMRLKKIKSEVVEDLGDLDYLAEIAVLSPVIVDWVKHAQRHNGSLPGDDLERRFERFATDAVSLLQREVDQLNSRYYVNEESVFWLEEMKVLGKNQTSFEIGVSLATAPDPTPW